MTTDATPLLRAYARVRLAALARLDPVAAQTRVLRRLVRTARGTRFGRDHDFAAIAGAADPVAAFQARVPLRRYEAFWHDYWHPSYPVLTDVTWPGRMPLFALSSGTTSGVTKYIPCSDAICRANTRAALDLLCHHVAHRPASRVLGGRSLVLGGSTALSKAAPGIFQGDLSGIAVSRLPWWARRFQFPPVEVALLEDWEDKVARIAALARDADIRAVTGTPSWLLILFARQAALAGAAMPRAAALYPNLDLLVHGGVNFTPYRERFTAFLEGSRAELREVYPASEGFVALADAGPDDGLRLLLDNGLFFEFVPLETLDHDRPVRRWIADAALGVNYALVVSSCAGLWSYVIGDTVRLVSRDPPRLVITGRTSYSLSAFGEHLIGEDLERAVAAAAQTIGADVTDFTVGALHPTDESARGGHLFLVEFADAALTADRRTRFAAELDRVLAAHNEDYRVHRAGDFGMAPPRVEVVTPGGFARWMKQRGKLGGQNKVPRVITDPALLDTLRRSV